MPSKSANYHPTFIRHWRKYRHLSLMQLADRVSEYTGKSMTHANLSRIENGKTGYTQRTLEAIAHALLCEPADLIMRNPLDKSAAWSILDQMKKADPETRARIAAVVEALSKTGS